MKKRNLWISLLLIAALTVGGCSAKSDSAAYDTEPSESQNTSSWVTEDSKWSMSVGSAMESGAAEEPMEPEMEEAVEEEMAEETAAAENDSVSTAQKLIKTVDMEMETKEFDTLLPAITEQVNELGGYVETSEISGSSYYGSGRRYAYLTLRIPANKLDGFVSIMGELGNVTYKNENVQDITLQYVDVESRKIALVTEQERLLELLEGAENMDDIIRIESRLSEIRYELQSYESQLRVMDNKVNYSTVSVSVSEVERITKVEEKTFWEEITYKLSDNLYDIGQGARSFAIWFVSSLPYLAIWAVVVFVMVKVILRLVNGKKKKGPKAENKNFGDPEGPVGQ